MDPHEILGIEPGATQAEIERAFREKSEKYHPDRGGEVWVFNQIEDAYQQLKAKRDGTPALSLPVPPPPPESPAIELADGDSKIDSQIRPVEIPNLAKQGKRTRLAKGRTRVPKGKQSGNRAVLIGGVLGGVTALPFLFYVLWLLNRNDSVVNDQPQTVTDQSIANARPDDRSTSRRSHKDSNARPQTPNGLDEAARSRSADSTDRPARDMSTNPDPSTRPGLPEIADDPPDDQPVNSDERTREDSEFWSKLQQFDDQFYDMELVSNDEERRAAQREWLEAMRQSIEGMPVQFVFDIAATKMVRRGRYELMLENLRMGSFHPRDFGGLTVTRGIEIRRTQTQMSKLNDRARLVVDGNIYISGPDKQLNLSSNQYLGVFQIEYRGREEQAVIAFAIRNPTFQFRDSP